MTVTTILDSLKMTATLLSRLSHFRLSELTVYLCSMRMEVCDVLSSTIKKKREENERREEESSQENSSVFARHSVRRCRELFFQRSFYEMELLSPSLSLSSFLSVSFDTRYFATTWYVDRACIDILSSLTQAPREKRNRAEL